LFSQSQKPISYLLECNLSTLKKEFEEQILERIKIRDAKEDGRCLLRLLKLFWGAESIN